MTIKVRAVELPQAYRDNRERRMQFLARGGWSRDFQVLLSRSLAANDLWRTRWADEWAYIRK